MKLLELYNSHPHEPLVPTKVNREQMVWKFNSPQHYVSWVQGLHELGREGGSPMSQSENTDSSTVKFTLSKSLDDAYAVLRETKFDPKQTDILQARISELKKGTFYSDEGYELEIPEYLAGGTNIWLKQKVRSKPTRVIDDTLLIDACYNCGRDAETSRKIGMQILTSIYRRNVIPRKVVVCFGEKDVRTNNSKDMLVAIDVSFADLNGIAKLLHPAAFRRLFFRVEELMPDLRGGYGYPYNGNTQKGYISIDRIYPQWNNEEVFESEIDTFLGVKRKK